MAFFEDLKHVKVSLEGSLFSQIYKSLDHCLWKQLQSIRLTLSWEQIELEKLIAMRSLSNLISLELRYSIVTDNLSRCIHLAEPFPKLKHLSVFPTEHFKTNAFQLIFPPCPNLIDLQLKFGSELLENDLKVSH